MKRSKETPSPVERKKIDNMTDKYIDSLQSDSDQEYDLQKCDKFEELESSDDKLSVTDMFKDLMKEI